LRVVVRLVEILGPDRSGQAVIRAIGTLGNLVEAAERQHADNRAEDLVASDRHLVTDIVKDRGLDKEAVLAAALPARNELGPLLAAELHVSQDLVKLFLRTLRPLLGRTIERIAHAALLGLGGQSVDELAMDFFFDKQPASRRAALPAVKVNGV